VESSQSSIDAVASTIRKRYCVDTVLNISSWLNSIAAPLALLPFFPQGYQDATLPNPQQLNWELFEARIESSSYIPKPNQPEHAQFMAEMKQLFDAHAHNGMGAV